MTVVVLSLLGLALIVFLTGRYRQYKAQHVSLGWVDAHYRQETDRSMMTEHAPAWKWPVEK